MMTVFKWIGIVVCALIGLQILIALVNLLITGCYALGAVLADAYMNRARKRATA